MSAMRPLGPFRRAEGSATPVFVPVFVQARWSRRMVIRVPNVPER